MLGVCYVQAKNPPAIQMKKTKLRSNPAPTAARVATKTISRTSIQHPKKNQKLNDRRKGNPARNRRTAAPAPIILSFINIYGTNTLLNS